MNGARVRWSISTKVGAIAIAATGCLALGMMQATPTAAPPKSMTIPLFSHWPKDKDKNIKPDLAIILTGEQQSYLKFCGCSVPQLGGFERRSNFTNQLKAKGWPIVALDLGDVAYRKNNAVQAQTLLKYKTAMQAMDLMGYAAVGLGEQEFKLPLIDGLAAYTLQFPNANPKILAANLKDRDKNFPSGDGKGSMIGDVLIIDDKKNPKQPKVGVLSLIGPSVQDNIADKTMTFNVNQQIIPAAIDALKKADVVVRVLLYQGTVDEASKLANNFPDFHLILCKTPQEEPPVQPTMVGNSMIVNVGWKGRKVGIAGVFRDDQNPKKFKLNWEIAAMTEEFETPPAEVDNHPIVKLLEEYSKQVKDQNLLALYPKVPHPMKVKYPSEKVEFVGSKACYGCHTADFTIWQNSKHSHAYDGLAKVAAKPSLRQFDGECIVCHTVGFQFASGFKNAEATPNLKDVGCENCHGPGSLHVAQPNNKKYYGDLSPWKVKPTDRVALADGKFDETVLLRVDQGVCMKCHDAENDPGFRFENFWPKIKHGGKAAPTINAKAANAAKK